jgi:DNA-binding transcriptional MocR family regulator
VKLQELEHKPPVKYALSIGVGSQDLLTKAFEMLIDPGSSLLVEDPTYTGALSFLNTQPVNLVGVATDALGIIPETLDEIMNNWEGENKPKAIYIIPCGSNPTGASATMERKREVYDVCKKHNLLILEDDPYYYLQFKSPRVASYLSIDVDGRVLRFDSMSKILSSGVRIGWVTGPAELVKRIDLHTMVKYMTVVKWGKSGRKKGGCIYNMLVRKKKKKKKKRVKQTNMTYLVHQPTSIWYPATYGL